MRLKPTLTAVAMAVAATVTHAEERGPAPQCAAYDRAYGFDVWNTDYAQMALARNPKLREVGDPYITVRYLRGGTPEQLKGSYVVLKALYAGAKSILQRPEFMRFVFCQMGVDATHDPKLWVDETLSFSDMAEIDKDMSGLFASFLELAAKKEEWLAEQAKEETQ